MTLLWSSFARGGGEDEAADDVLPVFVPALEPVFHGCEMGCYSGEFEGGCRGFGRVV